MTTTIKSYKDKSCIETSVVMLPTEKANQVKNQIVKCEIPNDDFNGKLILTDDFGFDRWHKPQHLYFTTDEEIKEGQYFFNLDTNSIELAKHDYPSNLKTKFKVVATTDDLKIDYNFDAFRQIQKSLPRPSDSFLRKYVEKNGKIDKVLVETETKYLNSFENSPEGSYQNRESVIKVAPDNTITTFPIKNTWDKNEVESLMISSMVKMCEWKNEGMVTFQLDKLMDNYIKEKL